MSPVVNIGKSYLPSRFDDEKIKRQLRNALKREARVVVQLLNSTVQHWHGIRPTFKYTTSVSTIGKRTGDLGIVVYPDGSKDEIDKWWRLNDGTSVRYATMQKGYQRKTSPNRLATKAGSVGKPYVNKSKKQPGIKPRNWTRIVARRRQPILRRELTAIVRNMPRKGAKP